MAMFNYSEQEKKTLRKMWVNAGYVFAGFNMVKMEGNGFALTMAPVLDELYKDELYKIIPLKELLKIILKIEKPNISNESIIIQAYLLINKTSAYKLAKEIDITKQALSRFLNGYRPFPNKVLKRTATFLKINSEEFSHQIEQFLFDEEDL